MINSIWLTIALVLTGLLFILLGELSFAVIFIASATVFLRPKRSEKPGRTRAIRLSLLALSVLLLAFILYLDVTDREFQPVLDTDSLPFHPNSTE